MHHEPAPSLDQLVILQENGNPNLPADYYSDCADLWELSTGQRTLPQDKSQRLYILGIRETRISGRMRLMSLVPTASMVADSLTKPMVSPQLLHLMSTGKVEFKNEPDHPVKSRVLPTIPLEDEADLLMTDEEVIKKAENSMGKVLMSTASVLFGLVAGVTSKSLLAATAVSAMATPVKGHSREAEQPKTDGDYMPFYILIFLTVLIAIAAEKAISRLLGNLGSESHGQPTERTPATKRTRPDGEEEQDGLPTPEPMDLEDESFSWTRETAIPEIESIPRGLQEHGGEYHQGEGQEDCRAETH